jgi:hypothetical protein
MDNGKVRTEHLKKELITVAQLEAAARKQGFASLVRSRSVHSGAGRHPLLHRP